MRKKSILTLLVLLCYYITFSQESIEVNPIGNPLTNLTAGELVRDVLIANNKITFDPTTIIVAENPDGAGNARTRSWGYFNRGASNFPFEEGIILTTGKALDARGPNSLPETGTGQFGWLGDIDLKTILDNSNGDMFDTHNATVFQFDFIPDGSTLIFDFIFASEEYEDNFECDTEVRDGFAFLIKGPGIPNNSGTAFGGSNLAAIPGSNNIAVNTGSIHTNTTSNGSLFRCTNDAGDILEEVGVNFFPELYVSNSGGDNTNVVQYDGYTKTLSTEAALVAGETYTIKFVIADRGDPNLDSAVFIRGFTVKSNVIIVDEDDSELDFKLCDGDTEILTAKNVDDPFSGSETYEWFLDDVIIPGETSSSITVSQSGTYKVIVTDLGETIEDRITVTVINAPDAGVSNELTLCSTDIPSDLFEALGGTPDLGGIWSPTLQSGTGLFDPMLDPVGIYTYTIAGTSDPGCPDASAAIDVAVISAPTLELKDATCSADQSTYDATFTTNGTWDITIEPTGAGTIDITNAMITGIAIGTNITITATNPSTSTCNVATLAVTSPTCGCPLIAEPTNPSNQSICQGESTPVLSVDVLAGQTANWYTQDGTLLRSGVTSYTPTETTAGEYIYRVEAFDDSLKCVSDLIDVIFNIISVSKVELESNGSICVDNDGNPIDNGDLPVIDTFLSDLDFSFVWSLNGVEILGETSASITAVLPGEYTVTYTYNATDCSDTSSTIISTSSGPEALSLTLSLGAFEENNSIIATVTGEGTYEFSLDNGERQEDGLFENVTLGFHEVTAYDSNGCGSITEGIFVIGFPKYFSPNGDLIHDTWNVIADFELPEMNIFIFDRYGKLLKQISPNGQGWDGTYNGKNLPSTEYWFTAEFLDGSKTFRSHFALIR